MSGVLRPPFSWLAWPKAAILSCDMPTGLLKYFSTDRDKLERFTNGQIYLTPPKYFNDPWDFLVRSEPPSRELLKRVVPCVHPASVAEFQAFVSTADSLEAEAREVQEGLSKLIGLVCLTENPLDRLMWAHYGESHQGFVAEFEHSDEGISKAGFRVCDTPFGGAVKVDYQSVQPVLKRDTSNMEEVVVTKHASWEYEQEWRVMQSLAKGAPHPTRKGFVLVGFGPSHLLRVILGLRATTEVRIQLRQMLNHEAFKHVRREVVCIDPHSRELKTCPLSW